MLCSISVADLERPRSFPQERRKRRYPVSSHVFIVSDHKYHKHPSLELAQTEMARLSEKFPEKKFRIYKVHRHIKNNHQPKKSEIISSSPIPPTEPIKITLANFKPKKQGTSPV